jgi:hypothetical protein
VVPRRAPQVEICGLWLGLYPRHDREAASRFAVRGAAQAPVVARVQSKLARYPEVINRFAVGFGRPYRFWISAQSTRVEC